MSFADLHHASTPLLLPNAWDVPSALAFLDAGFDAIGTTSFGVASSLGRPDGERATKTSNISLARALSPLPCYVSVDIEDGYADDPDRVAGYICQLAAGPGSADYAGELDIAGINIEDSTAGKLISPEAHAAKVTAIKACTPELFVNARVDTYWLDQDATVASTLDRAEHYVAAGADGIFVPGATEPDLLRELAANIPVPLNVLVVPGLTLGELGALGIRRVSTGSLPYRAAMHAAIDVATAVRDHAAIPAATPYADLQNRLSAYAR